MRDNTSSLFSAWSLSFSIFVEGEVRLLLEEANGKLIEITCTIIVLYINRYQNLFLFDCQIIYSFQVIVYMTSHGLPLA